MCYVLGYHAYDSLSLYHHAYDPSPCLCCLPGAGSRSLARAEGEVVHLLPVWPGFSKTATSAMGSSSSRGLNCRTPLAPPSQPPTPRGSLSALLGNVALSAPCGCGEGRPRALCCSWLLR